MELMKSFVNSSVLTYLTCASGYSFFV